MILILKFCTISLVLQRKGSGSGFICEFVLLFDFKVNIEHSVVILNLKSAKIMDFPVF